MNDTQKAYYGFKKPKWAPPAWLFGPVWTILYILISISFYRIFDLFLAEQIGIGIIVVMGANLLANALYLPIQFWFRSHILALFDAVFLWGTTLFLVGYIFAYDQLSSYLLLPYFFWLSFACILQANITYLNR